MPDSLKVGRREVKFTHPDKVLFPQAKLTKRDLAHHYERVAPVMLPYVKGHPLALQSYPGGIGQKGFFMKAVPD
jgi:bifunctional non-homologous end joining protein LigD